MASQANIVAEELDIGDAYLPLQQLVNVQLGTQACGSKKGVAFLIEDEGIVDDYAVEQSELGIANGDRCLQLIGQHKRCLRGQPSLTNRRGREEK